MKTPLLTPQDYRVMPWKNGLGSTTEIARAPDPADTDRYLWRISIADVAEDGPFSAFDGYERLIATIEGAGMELNVDGVPAIVRHRAPAFAFSGAADVTCRLIDGPIRDFNLIYDPEQVRGAVQLLGPGGRHSIDPAADLFLHLLEGGAEIAGQMVSAGETLHLQEMAGPLSLSLGEDAWAVLVSLSPAG